MTAWLNALVMTAGGGGASGGDGGKQSEHAMQSHFEQWSDLCFSLHQGAQIGRGHVVICAAAQECPRSSRSARALFFASYVDPERVRAVLVSERERSDGGLSNSYEHSLLVESTVVATALSGYPRLLSF